MATLHLKWHDLLRKPRLVLDHALTIRDASTLPAHASMLSGVRAEGARPDLEHLAAARGLHQVADHLHARDGRRATTAFFTGKTKLRHIVPPGAVGMYERPGYYCKKVAEGGGAPI